MEANVLGTRPPADALHQRAYGEGGQQAETEAHLECDQGAGVVPFGSGGPLVERTGGLIVRSGYLLLFMGVGIGQLVWVFLLVYGAYSIWQWLPL